MKLATKTGEAPDAVLTAWTWMGLLRAPIQRTVRDQVTGTGVGASSDALHQAHFSVQGPHGFECTVQQQHSSPSLSVKHVPHITFGQQFARAGGP